MKCFISLALSFLCCLPVAAGAQEEMIKQGDQLTLQRCVDIGLRQHPTVIAAQNTVRVGQARVGQAKSAYYPQIGMTAAYSRVKSGSGRFISGLSNGTSVGSGSFDQYSGVINLNQNIYDFGKTGSGVSVQQEGLEAARSDLETTSEQIAFAVKRTYYGVLQAQRNQVVAEESVKQFEKHLEQAKGFYEVGTKPKYDVTRAEVDLGNAKLNLIKTQNALRLAHTSLNNAMGLAEAPAYTIEDNLSFEKYVVTFPEALDTAYQKRPDLAAILARKRAAEATLALAKTGYYPTLAGNASYSRSGESFPLQEGWSIGATLTFSLFSGFSTRNQVEEAQASLDVLRADEEALRQSIYLEVRQSFLNLNEAEERIGTAELTVRQATENFDIANGRYEAGVGNPIEVTDAEVTLINAKTGHIQALYDYKVSRASLELAMGLR